jgi:hypothetical protein
VTALSDKLTALHELHLKHPLLYFHAFNPTVIPETRQAEPALYMREQYHHFMDNCFTFKNNSTDREDIAVCIRKLMSQPIGQRLIVKLNQLNEKYGCRITVTAQPNGNLAVRPVDGSQRNETPAMTDKTEEAVAALKFFDAPRKAWNKIELLYPPKFWQDAQQYVFKTLDFGKNKCLVFKPPFISIGHELTHALHFFRGKDRCKMPFPVVDPNQHTNMLFMKNTEELWTIDLGNISENKLRQEHGIHLRYSHIRASQFAQGPYSMDEIGETMKEVRAAESAANKEEKEPPVTTHSQTSTHPMVILPLDDDKPSCCNIS